MNKSKLLHLIKQEEGFKLDFKFKLSLDLDSDKKEFVKDIIAIANTEGGRGYIIFGIEDKTKRIVGLKDLPLNMEERIQQIITYRSVPPVSVSFEVIELNKKQVGVLTIFKSRQVPHQMIQNGAFYVRRGSTTDILSRHEIAKILQSQGIISFEMALCRSARLEDLDFDMIDKYLGGFPVYQTQKIQLFRVLGLIGEDDEGKGEYPTYGGLLLFGRYPHFFIPHALLEVFFGKERFIITGNIMAMLEDFERKVKHLLPSTYPFEGLREVVANAMIHRDYWNSFNISRVYISPSFIKVSNPRHYEFHSTSSPKTSRTNPWLYSRLLLLEQRNSNVHFGIGLEAVRAIFKEKMQVNTPVEEHYFEVILPGTQDYEHI